ncbi:MAG: helix-turn-helix domain-containing protein [Thermodesulfobacteriota bacterium]
MSQPQKKKAEAKPRKRRSRKDLGEKGLVSRENILKAARRVFAKVPFPNATMRMIGSEGGFEHPLVHYYFPTKADLFDAVMAEICEELAAANESWFSGLSSDDVRGGWSIFLDRVIAWCVENPEPFRIIFLNMAEFQRVEDLPGLSRIPGLMDRTREVFLAALPVPLPENEVKIFNNVIANMLICFLGADLCHAMIVGMEPLSEQYRQWVKSTLLYLFLPWTESLIQKALADMAGGAKG